MSELLEATIYCPYCGERLLIFIDPSVDQQHYIEDCQVCCKPIELDVVLDPAGGVSVVASHENE